MIKKYVLNLIQNSFFHFVGNSTLVNLKHNESFCHYFIQDIVELSKNMLRTPIPLFKK